MKPLFVHTRRFPPRRYHAITLFPFVFYNGQPMDEIEVRHETVHLWQQAALLIVGFYVLYFVFWFAGVVVYRDLDKFGCVLQYTRSGRIAVTRGTQEQVSEFLEQRDTQNG